MLGIQPAKASTSVKLTPVKQLNVQKNNSDGSFLDVNTDPDIFDIYYRNDSVKNKNYGSMTFSGVDTTKSITSAILKLQVVNNNDGKESKLRIDLGSNSAELTSGFPALVETMGREVTVPKHEEPRLYQIDVKDYLESLSPSERANPIFIMSSDSSNMTVVKSGNTVGREYDPYLEITYGAESNSAPTDIALSSSSVEENKPVGTAVGTLSAIDPDAGDSFTYSLVAGTGDTDNSSFTITGNQLKTAQSFDYETKSSYNIRVRVTDSAGNPFEKALTINVTDVNEHTGPTIVSLSPVNNASGVPISSNLTMTFNEAVTTASGNIYIVRNSDDAIVQTIAASSQSVVTNGAIVTIDLPADLASGMAYHVEMDAGAIKNAAQQGFQGIADATTWRFTADTQSANADLSSLTLSQGTLSPTFAAGVLNYKASVPSSVTGITVIPTAADNKSEIQVNGTTVNNGQASSNISLNPGLNKITIVVTAQNGDINTYVVEVERAIAATTEPAPTVPANIVTAEDTKSGNIVIRGGPDTKFFKVSGITGGKLYKANDQIEIMNGDFITIAEGSAGLQFMPNLDANGTTGFGFNVQAARDNAGAGLSSATMVQIKVTEVNDAPTIAIPISNLQIIAGKSNSIDVSNTFSDVDGDTLTLSATSSASNVAFVQFNQQQLTIQGLAVGTADITVIAIDNHGGMVTDTFTVVITNTNPVFPNPTIIETVEAGKTVSGTVAATDTDGHVLTYSLVTTPAYGAFTIISNGTWIYANTSSLAGNESFKIQVSDGYGGTAVVTVNIAVTAPSHTVSFDVDGGSAVASQTIADGEKVTTPAAPTKAGYTFGGWYTSNAYTTVFDFNSTITANTVVYAKWITIPIPVPHTVSFDVDGGSMVAPQTIADGGKVSAPTAPTKPGHTFGGWYTSNAYTTPFDFDKGITANTVVYAKWIAIPIPVSHTVSFDVDGGSAVASQTIADGGKATLPTPPTKAGHMFGGWYTSNAYTTVFDFNSTITANTVVYVKWITIPIPVSHTVSFNVDGGSAVAPQTIVDGGKVTAPAAPTKAGYTFGGWYKETSFATEWNFATDIVDANTTLYARWIRDVTPPTDSEAVAKAKAALVIGYSTGDSVTSVTQKLTLPVTGEEGTTVSWTSGNPAVVTANGVVQRPSVGDSTVILTATIVKGNVKETKQFIVVVKGYNNRYPPVTSTPDSPPSNTEQVVLDIVSGSGGVVSKVIIKRTKNADGTFNDVVTLTEQSVRDAVAKLKELGLATARLILPEQQDKVNELYVSIPKDVVTILRSEGVNLEIGVNNARILILVSSFATLYEDVYFRILPMSTQVGHSEILERARKEASGIEGVDSTVIHILGRSMKIETNLQNRPVDLTLPLPANVRQEQLSHLAIYIEHSDGTKEIVSGKVVTLADGKLGIQFTVQKFSTFTVLYMPKKEVVEEEVPEEILPEEAQISYIQGYTDGTFRPNAHITRAQMAAMLARNLSDNDVPASSKISYSDTAASWAKDEIEYVRTQGIMNGRADGMFGPNELITRAQMAAIAMRWIDKQCAVDDTAVYCTGDTTNITFNDVNSQHWAATYIEEISALGIMTGMNASTFNPEGTLTRAQAVKVLNRLFERELVTNEVPLFSDVPSNHWAFDEIQAAAKK